MIQTCALMKPRYLLCTAVETVTGATVDVTKDLSDPIYTITFTSPATTDFAALVVDGDNLANTAPFISLTGTDAVEVLKTATDSNTSLKDLEADVQNAINAKLESEGASGISLGFFESGLIADGGDFTASYAPASTIPSDMPFTITIGPEPTASSSEITPGGVGVPASDEQQDIVIANAGGGSFTLSFGGDTTGNIPFGASNAQVKAALSTLTGLTSGDFDVSASFSETGELQKITYSVLFKDSLGGVDITSVIGINGNNLKTREYNGILRKANVDANGLTTALQTAINKSLAANGGLVTVSGTAQSGSTSTTIKLSSSSSVIDDFYNGLYVEITGGAGELGESFEITDYDGTTKIATIDGEWTTDPVGGSTTYDIDDVPIGVLVSLDGGNVKLESFGGRMGITFVSPIQAIAGGGRISLSAPTAKVPVDPSIPSIEVERWMQITTNYDDAAFQELGLQSSPTRFDGTTQNDIAFTLKVNDDDTFDIHLASGTRTDISQLVDALQSQINSALDGVPNDVTGSFYYDSLATDPIPDIEVKQTGLDEDNPNGNRIIFTGREGAVTKFSIFIPEDGDPFTGGTQTNGAVTELGFEYGQGETKVGKATEFFLEDVRFGGNFGLFANDLSATASLGFLGIKANAVGTLDAMADGDVQTGSTTTTVKLESGDAEADDYYNGYYIRVKTGDAVDILEIKDYAASGNEVTLDGTLTATPVYSGENKTTYKIVKGERFLDARVDFDLRNPLVAASHEDSHRVTIGLLTDAINDGQFLFDAADIGGTEEDPATGFIDGVVDGSMGLILGLRPDGFLSGLPANLGSIEFGIDDPNWLAALPTFSDPLGLGSENQDVTGGVTFDGYVVPSNGVLTEDMVFVVSQKYGDTEAERVEELVVLKAEDTSDNTSRADLQSDLNHSTTGAITKALARLQDDIDSMDPPLSGTNVVGTITATISSEGVVSLSGTAGTFDGTTAEQLDVRGNIIQLDFNRPSGWEELIASLSDLSFDDILMVLRLVVDFLQGLDGSDGGGIAASIFSYKIPLVDRSLSDIIDIGGDFLDFIDELIADPQGSLQKLEVQFRDLLDLVQIGDPLGIFSGGLSDIDLSGVSGFTFPEMNIDTDSGFTGQLLEDLSFNLTFSGVDYLIELRALDTAGLNLAGLIAKLQEKIDAVLDLPDLSFDPGDLIAQNSGSDLIQLLPKSGVSFPDLKLNPFSILKFDFSNMLMTMDFNYMVDAELTRPFNLDLANLGLPAALTNLVGLSASGNLGLEAEMDFNLSLGLDLDGTDATPMAFFLDVDKTYLSASAKAYGEDLDFEAALGPVGLFVFDGAADLTAEFGVKLKDGGSSDTDGRLNLVAYGDGTLGTDLTSLGSFIDTTLHTQGSPDPTTLNDFITGAFSGFYLTGNAKAHLPLYFGLKSSPIPLGSTDPSDDRSVDFAGDTITVKGNELFAGIDLVEVFDGAGDGDSGFEIELPVFDFSSLQLPSLFALLSDPAVIVNGLNKVLQEIEGIVQGEIMGVEIPFLGDLLADNPVANFIEDFRLDFLQPLADTLVKNNVNLEGLLELIQGVIFDVFHDKLDILDDSIASAGDIPIVFLDEDGNEVNLLSAQAVQIEFDLGGIIDLSPDDPITRDLGIPALGLSFNILPNLQLEWRLHFGFGIDTTKGLYFVTNYDEDDDGELDPELYVGVNMDLGSSSMDRVAGIEGNLAFLKLEITDGLDLDDDGLVEFGPANPGSFDELKQSEFSRIVLSASIDITDPDDDGKLTIPELITTSPLETFDFNFFGGVVLRAEAEVNLGGLDSGGTNLANALPSIRTGVLVDFGLEFGAQSGLQVQAPDIALVDVTLDLGDFIGGFASDLLGGIKAALDPLEWLIGPDGLLNMRLPIISDLLGETIRLRDLMWVFDQENAPKVDTFLNFVEKLYWLIDLVDEASGMEFGLNFGDLVLFDSDGSFATDFPDLFDKPFNLIPSFGDDIRRLPSFDSIDMGEIQDAVGNAVSGIPSTGAAPSTQQSFTAGVTDEGGITFPILEADTIFGLLMGKPATLFLVELPELGFEFMYRQVIPIWGPLAATFGGGISGGIDFGFGYDTLGLSQTLATKTRPTC
jgi:hypothetical protein